MIAGYRIDTGLDAMDMALVHQFISSSYWAKNIPLEEVAANIEEFKSFNNPVVLYCRSGNRSGMAVNILKQAGFKDVYNGGSLFDMQQLKFN